MLPLWSWFRVLPLSRACSLNLLLMHSVVHICITISYSAVCISNSPCACVCSLWQCKEVEIAAILKFTLHGLEYLHCKRKIHRSVLNVASISCTCAVILNTT